MTDRRTDGQTDRQGKKLWTLPTSLSQEKFCRNLADYVYKNSIRNRKDRSILGSIRFLNHIPLADKCFFHD